MQKGYFYKKPDSYNLYLLVRRLIIDLYSLYDLKSGTWLKLLFYG